MVKNDMEKNFISTTSGRFLGNLSLEISEIETKLIEDKDLSKLSEFYTLLYEDTNSLLEKIQNKFILKEEKKFSKNQKKEVLDYE